MNRTLLGLMLALFVTATIPAVAQEIPSDDEIISAISVYWGEGNNKTIAALQSQIRSATVEADENHYEARAKAASAKCPSDPCKKCEENIRDNPICFQKKDDFSIFHHIFLGADGLAKCVAEARGECLSKATDDWQNTVKKIKRWTEEIQDLTSGSTSAKARIDNRVFSVVRKNNYEGNIISYVNMRTKGTDNVEQVKVTMQKKADRWLVVGYEAVRQ